MLPADAALVESDPQLPGLSVLLDDGTLRAWLAEHAPSCRLLRRRYLRYKPGTGCVLGLELAGPDGPRPAALLAAGDDTAVKLAKAVRRAPAGAVLGHDPGRHLLLGVPAADRDLPALAPLGTPAGRDHLLGDVLPGTDWSGAAVATLSYKPQRRWVGLVRPRTGAAVLLRAHRPAVAADTLAVLRALDGGPPRLPALLGSAPEVGLVAVEHVPGRVLDQQAPSPVVVHRAGAALAALHTRSAPQLRVRPAYAAAEAALAAAEAVARVLPGLGDRARAVADAAGPLVVRAAGAPVPCHGDFSLDQAVLDPAGQVALIDLDEAALDDPALDLAGAVAAACAASPAQADLVAAALCDGYAAHRPLPRGPVLAAHVAALLLRRATEPFRTAHPRWPDEVARLVAAAERALP